jgi:hypothetical protein
MRRINPIPHRDAVVRICRRDDPVNRLDGVNDHRREIDKDRIVAIADFDQKCN